MLTAFIRWVACGDRDNRLDTDAGLQACKIIDQTAELYRSQQTPWLIGKLSEAGTVDDNLRYALSELLSAEGPLSVNEIDYQIENVKTCFSGANGAKWLEKLANTRDTARFIRALAT